MEGPTATPRITADPGSGVKLVASSVESDDDSDYVELRKKSPTILSKTLELEGHTHKLQKMHELAAVNLEDFSTNGGLHPA